MTNKKRIKKATRKSRKWNIVYKRDIQPKLPSIEEIKESGFLSFLGKDFITKKDLKTKPSARRLVKSLRKVIKAVNVFHNFVGFNYYI